MKHTQPAEYEALPAATGVMSAPLPAVAERGLMSTSSRPGRGLMAPDPDLPPFEWHRDGVAFLWLLALIVALIAWMGLLAQGGGQPHMTATAIVAATN